MTSSVASSISLECSPLLEMSQIGRFLPLAHRHQQAVGADEVALVADRDGTVVLGAQILAPDREWVRIASIALGYRPGAGERVVEHGDVVAQHVAIGLVEIDALLDDGAVVVVQRQPGSVEGAPSLDVARLDLE